MSRYVVIYQWPYRRNGLMNSAQWDFHIMLGWCSSLELQTSRMSYPGPRRGQSFYSYIIIHTFPDGIVHELWMRQCSLGNVFCLLRNDVLEQASVRVLLTEWWLREYHTKWRSSNTKWCFMLLISDEYLTNIPSYNPRATPRYCSYWRGITCGQSKSIV